MSNSRGSRTVNYDSVAPTFGRRYEDHDYSGVERTLRDFIGTGAHCRTLEVGCGTGHWLDKIAKQAHFVVGLDPSEGMLRHAELESAGFGLVGGCAEALPFPTNCFDRVVCINAFHHFSDKSRFIAEAGRVLRSGGGLMTVGLDPHQGYDQWWIHDYFPPALEIDMERYLACEQIRKLMSSRSFRRCQTIEAQHVSAKLDRAQLRSRSNWFDKNSTSQLTALTESEYTEGMRLIERDIQAAEKDGSVFELQADLRLYATVGWAT